MSFQDSPSRESLSSLNVVATTTAEPIKDGTIARDFSLSSMNSIASQDEQFTCNEHAGEVLVRMEHYLEDNQLCDVVLIAGIDGKRIPAHRIVLTASSAYFSAMFTGSLRETQQNEITLGEVKGDILQLLIKYCYSGRIDIRENNVENLLAASCLFQLNSVALACSNFLAKQLHPSNCIGFALFAEQQNCTTLLELARDYTNSNFLLVCKNVEFFLLNANQLANVLKSDYLNVASEQEVFQALIAWIQHDQPNRKQYIPELLALIRLPLLQPAFIADHVEALCDANNCHELVLEALKWHVLPERRSQNANERTRPRRSTMGRLLAIGGMDAQKSAICIESYCPRSNVWLLLKHMPVRRFQYGVALIEDKLIFVGGRDGLKTLNSVECLDLQTLAATPLGPMNTHRHGLSVAVLEGPLYAVGGHDGWTYLNTVERWDPISRTWSYVASMSTMRSMAAVAVLNGRLYVVGGRDSSGCHRSVECYDPHTNKWALRAPMNKRRGSVAVATLNGYLYALGGNDSPASNPYVCRTETVERYDRLTDTWTLIASLNLGRDAIGAATFGDTLIAVGGFDGDKYHKTVEQYDPETQKWTELAPLNFCRSGASLIEIPNNFPATPRKKIWQPVRPNLYHRGNIEVIDYYMI